MGGHRIGFALVAVLVLGLGAVSATDVAPSFTRHPAPYGLPNVHQAGEPSLGIDWRTGAVMYQAWTSTYRVTFDDLSSPPVATWVERSPTSSIFTVDPILFTDPVMGRTFAGGLNGACSVLSLTDTDGTAWTPMANTCSAALDHPSIAAGPWAEPPPLTASYPHAVYYCAQASFVQCSTSGDGGRTFGPAVTVTCDFLNPGFHGSLHVAPNGWVYLPFRTCGPVNGVAVSKDNGITWTARPLRSALHPLTGFDPDLASTSSSWVYMAYPTADHGVGAALTKDGGATWTDFGDVAADVGIASATYLEVVAGDDERAAIVHFGSLEDGDPYAPTFTGLWHVYVTYTMDAGETWRTVRASENVAHWGWLCALGNACQSNRQLFEFIDAQLDQSGRIVVAYADACLSACELGYGTSSHAHATILRQAGGAGLFETLAEPQLPATPQRLPEITPGSLEDARDGIPPARAELWWAKSG